MEYILKTPKNRTSEDVGESGCKMGVHGLVLSRRAVNGAFGRSEREKERARKGSEVVERSGANGAKPLSLGYETYLDGAVETPEDSMVADIRKNPLHRWKRHKQAQGKRNTIIGFSAGSRMRLMKKVASVAKGVPCHFVSLTFPCDISAKDAKEHLWALWRRFERNRVWKNKRIGMVWKMEPQKSGRWHFHLMVYGCKFIPHRWVKAAWSQILGSAGVKGSFHRGVDVRWVEGNLSAVQAYVSKYFGKDVEAGSYGEECGRVWGCRGDLPIKDVVKIGMTVLELTWLWRIISRKRKTNVVKMSCTLLAQAPPDWIDNARKLARM